MLFKILFFLTSVCFLISLKKATAEEKEKLLPTKTYIAGAKAETKVPNEKGIKDLREAFNVFDLDRDGQITPKELSDILNRIGHSKTVREAALMIEAYDKDNSGTIDFPEFLVMMATRDLTGHDEIKNFDAERIFNTFDMDGDNLIDATELFNMLRKLGMEAKHEDIVDIIREVDTNDDGKLDFDEFLDLIKKKGFKV